MDEKHKSSHQDRKRKKKKRDRKSKHESHEKIHSEKGKHSHKSKKRKAHHHQEKELKRGKQEAHEEPFLFDFQVKKAQKRENERILEELISKKTTNEQPKEETPLLGAMSKEQYDKHKNRLREEFDPHTGRMRLVKGDGEIVERIVSKREHQAINYKATHWVTNT